MAVNNAINVPPGAANTLLQGQGTTTPPTFQASPSCSGTLTAGTGLTATTGHVTVTAGNVYLPNTTSGAATGSVQLGGSPFMHNYGVTSSTFLGTNAGNVTNTGSYNTGVGYQALVAVTSGEANTCVGRISGGGGFTTCSHNTAVGNATLFNCTNDYNTAIGSNSMFCSVGLTGTANTCLGYATGFVMTSGAQNTALGYQALSNLTTGTYNLAIGYNAGSGYTSSEASNISIMANGTAAESNVLRIGTAGTGSGQVSKCYIAGINGVTVTGTAVLCATDGQLGTIASSARYKENIEDMPEDVSVLGLRPIMFNFKKDEAKKVQYGLLAEDVHETFPYLCHYNQELEPESVKYHELCTFLLHEIKKLNDRIKKLETKEA